MTCAEFLERYTDFRDGLVTAPRELRRFGRHLARCTGCRRYDAAVRRGVLALEGVRRPDVARVPVLPPVPFPNPVVQAGVPFVSFQDPRASVFAGSRAADGAVLVEPVSAGR